MSARTLKLPATERAEIESPRSPSQEIETARLGFVQNSARNAETRYPEWMDLKTVTRYAAVSERTIREWIHRATSPLPAVRVGTKILVNRSVFNEWLKLHPLSPANTVDVAAIAKQIITELAG
jgi:excisionase family DNA binding protein